MRSLTAVCLFLSLAAPAAAQEKIARVGWLDWQSSGLYAEQTSKGFLQGLREGGFVEGKNLTVVRGAAEGEWRRFSELARVMAAAKVDVFFTPGKASTDAAWYASRSTPTVFATVNDPVALGYVKSLGRPGMQVTGVMTSNAELTGKRLQLLAEMVPGAKRVGVLVHDAILTTCRQELTQMEAAAEKLGISLIQVSAGGKDQLNAAFKRLTEAKAQALMITLMTTRHGMEADVIELAERHRLPTMFAWEPDVRMGGLLSYGADFTDVYRRAGNYVARILKGGKPEEMAVEFPREFRLVVNQKTAKRLGIAIPNTILVRADEVIE